MNGRRATEREHETTGGNNDMISAFRNSKFKTQNSKFAAATAALALALLFLAPAAHADINKDLLKAAENGNTEKVKRHLATGADAHAKDKDGKTALIWTAEHGCTEAVKALLAAGADVNVKATHNGRTALMEAARWDHMETVQALLAAGADADATDYKGETALALAERKGNRATAAILRSPPAPPSAPPPPSAQAAPASLPISDINVGLINAALAGDTEKVRQLLTSGADANAKNKYERTALMHAAKGGHAEIIKALLDAGADVHAKDKDGVTALMVAERGGHAETAAVLREAEKAPGVAAPAAPPNGNTKPREETTP